MLNFIKKLFGATPAEKPAPYKVEAPEPAKCGCGRSPTGYCVGHHKLTDAEWASHTDNPTRPIIGSDGQWPFPAPAEEMKPAVKAKSARAKKAPVAAITPAEKPARKPRAKKAKE